MARKRRLQIIHDSASEVVPAVMTAVGTTIVSFLPVFFLTGRDYKLFAPLAWTKTFALTASLIVAVAIVPMLCRIFLRSSRLPRWAGVPVGLGMATLAAGLCYFVWGRQIEAWTMLSLPWATGLAGLIGFGAGFLIIRERIRPIEASPVSRILRWLYGGRLRFALNHKGIMLSFPAVIVVLGFGAWFGLPTVLRPFEQARRHVRSGPERRARLRPGQARVHRLEVRRLDRAG